MAYQIDISDAEDYVTVKHVGEVTYRELEEARYRIKDILLETGLGKIFVDLSEMIPVLEKVEKICFIGSHGDVYPADIRISVVVPDMVYESDRFVDELADLLDLNHRLFRNKIEAIAWLSSDSV